MPGPFLLAALLIGLTLLGGIVLQAILVSLTRASILAYMTWPVYRILHRQFASRDMVSALMMTSSSVLVLVSTRPE
jgi:predicted PurR-regulated permease PerM